MDEGQKQAVLSAIRTLLVVAGSVLVTKGLVSDAMLQQVVGAVMVLLPAAWGVWQKFEVEKDTKKREVVAVNVGIAVADRTAGTTPAIAAEKAPAVIKAFKDATPAPAPLVVVPETGLNITADSPVLPTTK